MARGAQLAAPFLKRIAVLPERVDRAAFPFNRLRFLQGEDFELAFEAPVTIFVGENASGKSTLVEAIAAHCGFSAMGGSSGHLIGHVSSEAQAFADTLRFSWLPKVTHGFFFRSESFYNVASYIDREGIADVHGGRLLHEQSHGESFLTVFQHRFREDKRSLFLLDEPETALSPARQLAFLGLLRQWERSSNVQVIMATHSPILMSYPGATILGFDHDRLTPVALEETEHYRITKAFLGNRDRYLAEIFRDED